MKEIKAYTAEWGEASAILSGAGAFSKKEKKNEIESEVCSSTPTEYAISTF